MFYTGCSLKLSEQQQNAVEGTKSTKFFFMHLPSSAWLFHSHFTKTTLISFH